MKYEKLSQAERLFDAMELIDDTILTETQTPQAARAYTGHRRQIRAWIALACAFAVITSGVFGGRLLSTLGNVGADAENNPPGNAPESPIPTAASLSDLLCNAAENGTGTPIEPNSVDFFDGNAKIIWQIKGDPSCYEFSFASAQEIERIELQMSMESDQILPGDAEDIDTYVWISYGDGRVVSPYLKQSDGNVGTAALFSYVPELLPSRALTRLIEASIQK